MVKKTKNLKYYEGVGRRKTSVARVRLFLVGKEKELTVKSKKIKQGEIFVNEKPVDKFFPSLFFKAKYLQPLQLTNSEDRFAISVIVRGGGINGQLDAMILALSRALEKSDKETFRPLLKKAGLLTTDSRIRERRKTGRGGKARKAKQSPKR